MSNLLPLSRRIAMAALRLNGTKIYWQKATMCPARRRDDSPCYDEESGSANINCPVCKGRGSIYAKGEVIYGVYTDNSNQWQQDPSGGFMMGSKTLSLPFWLNIQLLKERGGNAGVSRRLLRDKFTLLSPQNKPVEVVYLEQDPTKPIVGSGIIYQIIQVGNNE